MESPFPGEGAPSARGAPSASTSVRGVLGRAPGSRDPHGWPAGGRGRGQRWKASGWWGEKGARTQVREGEGRGPSRPVNRMDSCPRRVVTAAGRAAETGQRNFWIPGGGVRLSTGCVCPASGRQWGPDSSAEPAVMDGVTPSTCFVRSLQTFRLLMTRDPESALAFPNWFALRCRVLASATKGMIQNSILSSEGPNNTRENEVTGGHLGRLYF